MKQDFQDEAGFPRLGFWKKAQRECKTRSPARGLSHPVNPAPEKKKRAGEKPPRASRNRSGSGDPHLQKLPYTPTVDGDRQIASGTESGTLARL